MAARRFDTMFVRLFVAMAAIMVAVHILGVTVVESVFPRHRPGHDRHVVRGPAGPAGSTPSTDPVGSTRSTDPAGSARSSHAAGSADRPAAPVPEGHRPPPGPPGPGRPPPLGMLFQFAAIVAASWVGARVLARPVQQLARGAGRLTQDVHAPPLDELGGPNEAREAARAFNRMQQRIQTQLAQQARFLAAVSHDLRTPLTRMALRIERLGDADTSQRLRQDLAEMNALIDATLGYLREREGGVGPRQRVDIAALVQAVVDDAMELGQQVSCSGSAQPLAVYPTELRRALVNLLENAHRYAGGARMVLTDAPDKVVIDVDDDGPGIPPDELGRVLEPFYRIDSSRSRATGGVGMGLAIAADVVARHGGELTLENRPEGGLRARVTLPRG